MRKPSTIDLAIFWLKEQRGALGLVIVIVPLLAAWVLVLLQPRHRAEEVVGTVVGLGLSNTGKTGGDPVAMVRVGREQVTVALPPGHLCTVGGLIRLQRAKRGFGPRYQPEIIPCLAGGARDGRPAPAPRARGG